MRASKEELTKTMDNEMGTMSEAVWDEMHVEYDVFKQKFDVTPLLKGLPNDRDQCPHWGILTKGQMRVMYNEKEEIVKAGDAYYMPPGHTAIVEAGTEGWEFSPKDQLQKSMEVILRNMQAMMKEKK